MKKGKIILGIASTFITALSILAFKAAHKFTSRQVYVKVTTGGKCLLCTGLYFDLNFGVYNTFCHTAGARHATVRGTPVLGRKSGFFTDQTVGRNKCTHNHLITATTISL